LTETTLAPRDLLARFIRRWPVLVALTIVGGMLGWGAGFLRAPRYQAAAVLDVGFNYALTLPLTRADEGYVRERIRSLLVSDAVLADALSRLQAGAAAEEGISGLDVLRERIQLADRRTTWTFLATAGSPDAAAAIADAWASASQDALREAIVHAWRAAELQAAFFNLGCRLVATETPPDSAIWECGSDRGQAEPEDLADALRREVELTYGVVPALSVIQLNAASPPSAPVLWGSGTLILAGLILGVVAGLAAILPETWCVRGDPAPTAG
jgi:hypothetical protein